MNLQAVIWDMGGVLLRTDNPEPRQRLAERLQIPNGIIENLVFDSESSRRAQLGEIGVEEHWEFVRRELGLPIAEMPEFRLRFWEGDAVDEKLVEDIRALRLASYKMGLLSNAFSETRKFISEECQISDAFDQIIISAEEGIIKPDARIYQIALDRLGVSAQDSVFIDDSLENILGARQVGLIGIHFISPAQVRQSLQKLLDRSIR